MNGSSRPWPWHVVLAPVVPVLGLLTANLMMIPPRAAAVSVVVLMTVATLVWQLMTRLCGDSRTGALLSTLVMLTVLSGSTLQRLTKVVGFGPTAGAIALIGAFALAVAWLFRVRDKRGEVTRFVNVGVLLLAILLVGQIVRSEWSRQKLPPEAHAAALPVTKPSAALPDVYVLVLDGYGRADVLRDLYGYDNPLVGTLESLGFVVANRAISNYAQTALAVASLLNLDYVQALVGDFQHDRDDRRLLEQLIRNNRLFSTFHAAGYFIRAYASEYPLIRPSPVDERRRPLFPLTQFDFALYEESLLPRLSLMVGLPRGWEPARWHRGQVNWTLDDLEARAGDDRPVLVFAHVLLPHPPFVFTANGGNRATSLPISLNDGFEWRATARDTLEQYETGYVDALQYANARVKGIVDHALARGRARGRAVVMYLQGDHGPGSRLHRDDATATDLRERHSILLAARAPDGSGSGFYPTITPVNALRVVVNAATGSTLAKLDDRSYFSTWSDPYAFIDVTDRVR